MASTASFIHLIFWKKGEPECVPRNPAVPTFFFQFKVIHHSPRSRVRPLTFSPSLEYFSWEVPRAEFTPDLMRSHVMARTTVSPDIIDVLLEELSFCAVGVAGYISEPVIQFELHTTVNRPGLEDMLPIPGIRKLFNISERSTAAVRWALKDVSVVKGDESDCPICLSGLALPQLEKAAVELPCSHVYHRHCILKWLKVRDSCPSCRSAVPKACFVLLVTLTNLKKFN